MPEPTPLTGEEARVLADITRVPPVGDTAILHRDIVDRLYRMSMFQWTGEVYPNSVMLTRAGALALACYNAEQRRTK